jgi:two-component system CheB/CheR fusion protein
MPPMIQRKAPARSPRRSTAKPSRSGGARIALTGANRRAPVVGIGASAGGLDALKALFGAMPPKTGLAFVVVVHLDPTHESCCPMPAVSPSRRRGIASASRRITSM